ncbi:MAG: recombination mediator RecR [bacterium]|jgi:recombination protein RecR
MSVLPRALSDLIYSLEGLPGVGPRTAERYAYFLVQHDKSISKKLEKSLSNIHDSIKLCPITFALIDSNMDSSPLYSDSNRDKRVIAVVASPFDILAIERIGSYQGTYHVLGGLVSPIDGIGPEQLHIAELLRRIKDDSVLEIILATNASVEGETTALYINQALNDTGVSVTRLARGLPIGVDLEYADQITLGRAMDGRTAL